MKKLVVILPTFNEAPVIRGVVEDLKSSLIRLKDFQSEIVVVDDGSGDKTYEILTKILGITILRHPFNRGLGGAIGTGLAYAKLAKANLVVTFDADGQHSPSDIPKVLKPLVDNVADVVIGSRSIKLMPFDRKIITLLSNFVTLLLFGIYCSDSQSGFRGFNQTAIKKIELKTQRMEVSSEFFNEVRRHKLKLVEIPIRVIYTYYSRQKGQKNSNAFNVLLKLLLRVFK
jgi:glycosyltransferase involved in cell wall biosynthesis